MIIKNIHSAVEALKKGELVGVPTETVYGLAADALNAAAVAKIYELKQRPLDHPLIVHAADLDTAKELVTTFPDSALTLAQKFWPGPLTLVLPKKSVVPDITTGGLNSVAIRVPEHPVTLKLIRDTGFPLAAPSANPFGTISPTTAEHVEQSFGKKGLIIIDGGPCRVGVESTIISFLGKEPCILRLGGLSTEEIEATLGPIAVVGKSAKSIAPGMLPQHYAPRTPLVLLNETDSLPNLNPMGLLTLSSPAGCERFQAIQELSVTGNLQEAATRLYGAMRILDEMDLKLIVAYRFPDRGLGRAINDRLERASQNSSRLA
ncbi:MAG: threonylcarbamoyl-AMP synthase [Proteobacteria bacterium]|nr:threonylcarbamoyl-AMP synthase [Pseudomonadota bacterium]NDC23856.1 threonylcarbamoyl-AMP synthase [Pseudomonadota bacterium]NDD03951.1 threonylcarbamoyl-AMP synthase [Pseudomonadota bacterium]NDG26197.1 threonylcarbamoyl-AMP synthase [Pseudomonadota bacterium]